MRISTTALVLALVVPTAAFAADGDNDGYTDTGTGTPPVNKDCNDGDNTIYPGATEIPGDSIDQDCDGADATAPAGGAKLDKTSAPADIRAEAVKRAGNGAKVERIDAWETALKSCMENDEVAGLWQVDVKDPQKACVFLGADGKPDTRYMWVWRQNAEKVPAAEWLDREEYMAWRRAQAQAGAIKDLKTEQARQATALEHLSGGLSDEVARAQQKEAELQAAQDAFRADLANYATTEALKAEEEARIAGDKAEAKARADADVALGKDIVGEATVRRNADVALDGRLAVQEAKGEFFLSAKAGVLVLGQQTLRLRAGDPELRAGIAWGPRLGGSFGKIGANGLLVAFDGGVARVIEGSVEDDYQSAKRTGIVADGGFLVGVSSGGWSLAGYGAGFYHQTATLLGTAGKLEAAGAIFGAEVAGNWELTPGFDVQASARPFIGGEVAGTTVNEVPIPAQKGMVGGIVLGVGARF